MDKPKPLKGKTIYTSQVTAGDTAETNFVSKELHDSLKNGKYRFELFEKKDVKNAVELLKKSIDAEIAVGVRFDTRDILKRRIDEAFPDVI